MAVRAETLAALDSIIVEEQFQMEELANRPRVGGDIWKMATFAITTCRKLQLDTAGVNELRATCCTPWTLKAKLLGLVDGTDISARYYEKYPSFECASCYVSIQLSLRSMGSAAGEGRSTDTFRSNRARLSASATGPVVCFHVQGVQHVALGAR